MSTFARCELLFSAHALHFKHRLALQKPTGAETHLTMSVQHVSSTIHDVLREASPCTDSDGPRGGLLFYGEVDMQLHKNPKLPPHTHMGASSLESI